MTMLWIHGNAITGTLPSELGNISGLVRIDAIDNQLRGTIPSELAKLSHLERLNLSNNQLSGPIPSELANIPTLRTLQIERNSLTGDLTGICDARPEIILYADCEETSCLCCFVCCDTEDVCVIAFDNL